MSQDRPLTPGNVLTQVGDPGTGVGVADRAGVLDWGPGAVADGVDGRGYRAVLGEHQRESGPGGAAGGHGLTDHAGFTGVGLPPGAAPRRAPGPRRHDQPTSGGSTLNVETGSELGRR